MVEVRDVHILRSLRIARTGRVEGRDTFDDGLDRAALIIDEMASIQRDLADGTDGEISQRHDEIAAWGERLAETVRVERRRAATGSEADGLLRGQWVLLVILMLTWVVGLSGALIGVGMLLSG